jgi:hypothetical protein
MLVCVSTRDDFYDVGPAAVSVIAGRGADLPQRLGFS